MKKYKPILKKNNRFDINDLKSVPEEKINNEIKRIVTQLKRCDYVSANYLADLIGVRYYVIWRWIDKYNIPHKKTLVNKNITECRKIVYRTEIGPPEEIEKFLNSDKQRITIAGTILKKELKSNA